MVVARNITLLQSSNIVVDIHILKTLVEPNVQLIKATATLKDGSKLYVSESEGIDWRVYSYHWEKNDGLIRRWDNAPHHKKLPNFPHHVHDKRKVVSGDDVNLADVLAFIEVNIQK